AAGQRSRRRAAWAKDAPAERKAGWRAAQAAVARGSAVGELAGRGKPGAASSDFLGMAETVIEIKGKETVRAVANCGSAALLRPGLPVCWADRQAGWAEREFARTIAATTARFPAALSPVSGYNAVANWRSLRLNHATGRLFADPPIDLCPIRS